MACESNPGEDEIFRTRPDQPWGPFSLLYNGYQASFPGVKRLRRGVNNPPPPSAEVKERAELYLYSASGPSWSVFLANFTFYIFTSSTQNNLTHSLSKYLEKDLE